MVGFFSRLFPLFLISFLAVASLSELFQKAKEEFKLGSYTQALETLNALDAQSQKPGSEKLRAALLPGLLFYRGASLASLGRKEEAREAFEVFLSYQPNAQLDPALYPRPVITALQSARESLAKRGTQPLEEGTLAAAYRAFPPPSGQPPEDTGEDWADGPVRWLLTPEERRDYSRLSDPVSRSEFITTLWKARDPKPETPENEFRDEFEKRTAFADSRFAQDEKRGSLTDRGMVFILLGPPTYSGKKALQTGEDTADASGLSRFSPAEVKVAGQSGGSNSDRAARIDHVTGPGSKVLDASSNWIEVWHYQRANLPKEIPYQEVVFEFVTKQGYGKNVLQRDPTVLTSLDRAKAAMRRGSV